MTNHNKIIELIASALGINRQSVEHTVELLEGGATVPFIARYRKEATNGLDELQIQSIKENLSSLNELVKRKETVLNAIIAQDALTDTLQKQIDDCWDSTTLEDIYLPFKPKRRTRADIARAKGLEPLARIIMAQHGTNAQYIATRYINKDVASADDAIKGAKDIIAEWVSEDLSLIHI